MAPEYISASKKDAKKHRNSIVLHRPKYNGWNRKPSKEKSYDCELGKEFLDTTLKSIKEKVNKLDLIKS